MTIPTRPAPAVPPQMRSFNMTRTTSTASTDANASLEQLRLQLQQQQQQQKLNIKLPPPPKGGGGNVTQFGSFAERNNNNESDGVTSTSSVTRKFPKARYSPATNWNDYPFDPFEAKTPATNRNFRKVPPPRPPPPKMLVNGRQKTTSGTSSSSVSILSNIFHRKKTNSSSSNVKQHSAVQTSSASSGKYGINSTTQCSYDSITTSSSLSSAFTNCDWNAAWNSNTKHFAPVSSASIASKSQNQQEAQLISFDSPPSSPTFTQKSNSDCVSVDSFSSDSNFSSPQNGSVSQPESGFEDDFSATSRSRPATTSPNDPWEAFSAVNGGGISNSNHTENVYCANATIGTAPVRNLTRLSTAEDNPLCNGKNLLPPAPSLSMPTIIKPKISQKPKAPRPPMFDIAKPHQIGNDVVSDLPTPLSPPMPKCAPPPPPTATKSKPIVSILDVISGKADAIHLSNGAINGDIARFDDEPPHGIALYDFDGAEEGDLNFRENEKIYLLERVSEGWYRGRTRSGCEGILPTNYIEIRVPLPTEASVSPEAALSNSQTKINNRDLNTNVDISKVRCLYHFPSEVEGDLELRENDMVTILYRINEDWLFGKINNRQGQFPANFLEYIPANIQLP